MARLLNLAVAKSQRRSYFLRFLPFFFFDLVLPSYPAWLPCAWAGTVDAVSIVVMSGGLSKHIFPRTRGISAAPLQFPEPQRQDLVAVRSCPVVVQTERKR